MARTNQPPKEQKQGKQEKPMKTTTKGIQAIHVKTAIRDGVASATRFRRRTVSEWPDDVRNQRTIDALEELDMYVERLSDDEWAFQDIADKARTADLDVPELVVGASASDYLSRLGFGHWPVDTERQFDRLIGYITDDLGRE